MLPTEFADLEPFAQWCLPTEPERYAKRLSSSMTEMKAFYDAITPRAEEALTYCDKFPSTNCRTTSSISCICCIR